ncbi:hypothetical protein BC826DRAFT_184304 [Russula brevipes]|nr:hypothetical protein BC826DRAFT_184304 [Russula brevipes]
MLRRFIYAHVCTPDRNPFGTVKPNNAGPDCPGSHMHSTVAQNIGRQHARCHTRGYRSHRLLRLRVIHPSSDAASECTPSPHPCHRSESRPRLPAVAAQFLSPMALSFFWDRRSEAQDMQSPLPAVGIEDKKANSQDASHPTEGDTSVGKDTCQILLVWSSLRV